MAVRLESHEKDDDDGGRRQLVCTACGAAFVGRQDGHDHVSLRYGDAAASGGAVGLLMTVETKPGQSAAPSTSEETSEAATPLSGAGNCVDVDALAEQYANEVTEMFYGNDSHASTTSAAGVGGGMTATNVRRLGGVAAPCRSSRADRCRPFKCSQCGRRSNWRWDLKKHIRASRHPNASVIQLTAEEARRSFQVSVNKASITKPADLNDADFLL